MKPFDSLVVTDVAMEFSQGAHRVRALDHVDVSVQRGEFAALVGASGCGKSTLLRIIAGLESPTEGQVTLLRPDGEHEVVRGPSRDRAMVFQAYTSFPWLTVRQNLEFPLHLDRSRRTPRESAEEVDKFLALVGLQDFASQYPDTLSGGMRQRVAIARTLVNEPDVLLMDEPFGALDAQTRWQMQDLLLDVWKRTGCTVIFVTHDIEEAVYLASNIYVFSPRPGRIKDTKVVPFARPRTSDMRLSDEFKRLQVEILSVITETVLEAAAETEKLAGAPVPTSATLVDRGPYR